MAGKRRGAKKRHRTAVIGGGPAGLAAALGLAKLGHDVTLIERAGRLGGRALDLAASPPRPGAWASAHCASAVLMAADVCEEPNVRVLLAATPTRIESDGMTVTIDIHRQAAPAEGNAFACTGCDRASSNFAERPIQETIEADALVIATGADYDPASFGKTGQRVWTSWRLERTLAKAEGKLPEADGHPLLVFIQCHGSRKPSGGMAHCSSICCSLSLRQSLALRERHPDWRIVVLHNDMRLARAGEEALYRRARAAGVRFVRGRPARLYERGEHVIVQGFDTALGKRIFWESSLVVVQPALSGSAPCLDDLRNDGIRFNRGCFPTMSRARRILLIGACKHPMLVEEAIASGRDGALRAHGICDA